MIKTDKPQTLSPEEIDRIEAEPANRGRGKVQVLKFPSEYDPNRPAVFYALRPRRQLLVAVGETAATDANKANDMMINGCIIAGDLDQLEQDDEMYFGLLKECGNLFEAKKKI